MTSLYEGPLPEADQRYVDHCVDLLGEWIGEVKAGRRPTGNLIAIAEIAELVRGILDRERPSPWRDSVPENYLACMELLKENPNLELGPIEVVDPAAF